MGHNQPGSRQKTTTLPAETPAGCSGIAIFPDICCHKPIQLIIT